MESSRTSELTKELLARVCIRAFLWTLTIGVLGSAAVILYTSFYHAYIPNVSLTKPVYLSFSTDCINVGDVPCSFPSANVSLLHEQRQERVLMRGQPYRIFLTLDMPNSPVNQKLGMFMIKADFLTESGQVITSSSRSCILPYQSWLVQYLRTMVYSLPLVFGWSEEKQSVTVLLFDRYMENTYHPASRVRIVVMTKRIEVYAASIKFEAMFYGIRYFMHNWPVLSATVAIAFNTLLLSLTVFLAFKKSQATEETGEEAGEGIAEVPWDTSASDVSLTSTLSREGFISGEAVKGASTQTESRGASGRVRLSPLRRRTVRKRMSNLPPSRTWLRSHTLTPYRSGNSAGGNLQSYLHVEGDGAVDEWTNVHKVFSKEASCSDRWAGRSASGSSADGFQQAANVAGRTVDAGPHVCDASCCWTKDSEGPALSSNKDPVLEHGTEVVEQKVFALRETKSESCLTDLTETRYTESPKRTRSCTLFKLFNLYTDGRAKDAEALAEEDYFVNDGPCLLAGRVQRCSSRSEENLGTAVCATCSHSKYEQFPVVKDFSFEELKEAKSEDFEEAQTGLRCRRTQQFSY